MMNGFSETDVRTMKAAVLSELYRSLKEEDLLDNFDSEMLDGMAEGLASTVSDLFGKSAIAEDATECGEPPAESDLWKTLDYDRKVIELYYASVEENGLPARDRHCLICKMAARLSEKGMPPYETSPIEMRKQALIGLVPDNMPF
jgi:hypothetical protein